MNGRYFAADASVIVHVIAMMVVAMVVADSCVHCLLYTSDAADE